MAARDPLSRAADALRKAALAYPQATEDHPWGETAIKVKGKVFLFLSRHDGKLNMSMKLPVSNAAALEMPFATPTGYGLGKHGWVMAAFAPADDVPTDLLLEWLDESYRAVAPKTVLARLEEVETAKKPAKRKKK
jgi:predicted DNA-binding protein (MmcQ/YjbR family)